MARTVAILPARFASTRFPGKPLAEIDGAPMIVRVARRVSAAKRVDLVAVATDDTRIRDVVEAAGFRAVMTPADCATGTDRVACALEALEPAELVLNVQGDEPLIDPADVDALAAAMAVTDAPVGTLVRPIASADAFASPHVVKVARARNGRALYFSRAPIPHGDAARLQHIGIYAFRTEALRRIARLERTPLELAEGLEQLRWLEHGLEIHAADCVSARPSVAVDVPEDVARVVELLSSERS